VVYRPRRTIIAFALAHLLGMVLAAAFPLPSGLLLGATAVAALLALILPGRFFRTASVALLAAALLAGAAVFTVRVGAVPHDDLVQRLGRDQASATLVVDVVTPPESIPPRREGERAFRFEAEAVSMRLGAGWVPVSGRLRVTWHAPEGRTPPGYGEQWQWSGTVRRDDRPATRGQGVRGFLTVTDEGAVLRERGVGHPVLAQCYRWREAARERLGWGIDEPGDATALRRALLLGYRGDVPRVVHDAFARTGTLHILALSGMHVGILIVLLLVVLKGIGVPRPRWVFWVAPLLAVYTLGTGASPSTVRASVMATVFLAAYALRRPPDGATALAVSALLIAAVDPVQVFHPGFVLSFTVVAGLLAIYPLLRDLVDRATAPDPWGEPETGWWSAHGAWWRKPFDLMAISLAAWLASLPLIVQAFHVISPVALLVNLPLAPLAFVILLTACLALITSFAIPAVAVVFNYANEVFGHVLLAMVGATADWPGGHAYVAAWPWWLVVLWYILLATLVAVPRRVVRVAAGLALVVLVAGAMVGPAFSRRVEVVALGSGETTVVLVHGPGRQAVLLDAGPGFSSDRLVAALRERGVGRLDAVWITRATGGAYGGVSNLISSMRVGAVLTPLPPAGQGSYRAQWEDWQGRLPEGAVRAWPDEYIWEGAGGVVWRRLFPAPGEPYRNARVSALALHLARGTNALVVAGYPDVALAEAATMASRDWQAGVLVLGDLRAAHAAGPLLDAVAPHTLVTSARGFDRTRIGAAEFARLLASRPSLHTEEIDPDTPWSMRW
jgi:competence protein ComEC